MSKGTKQIRLGRVTRLVNQMEIILKTLQESTSRFPNDYTTGQIEQLEKDILLLKSEFQLD